jgi:Mn2+/Fe2+ NRAMP family transporter
MSNTTKIGVVIYILMTLLILFYQDIVRHKGFEYAVIYLLITIMILIGIIVVNS